MSPSDQHDYDSHPVSREPDDDDLAQALVLAEAAVKTATGDLDVDQIGRRFWEWAEENGRGIGIQTSDVLSRIGGAMPRCALGAGLQARAPTGQPAVEAAREAWEESGRYSGGNGAVMRCAPLAIRWMRDDIALARNTALSVVVTHADPRCVWTAVLVKVAVAMLLRGKDVGAFWCANQASDFEEAMVMVVSAGGDTDTNGAIAGAVLGARFGLEAIPGRWRERLAELRQGREPVERLADRLMAA